MAIPVAKLVERAAELFMLQAEDITGPSRVARINQARQAVMMASRESGRSYSQIGRLLGGRDHSTARHGCLQAEARCEYDALYCGKVYLLVEMAREFRVKYEPAPLPSKVLSVLKAEMRELRKMAA